MASITCPEFTSLDREIIGDFKSCLQENIEDIEVCIHKLDQSEDPDLIHELFRAMHSFKGNCRMVMLTPFVDVTHELEELVSEMRDGLRIYHHLYGSMLVNAIILIEESINTLAESGECDDQLVTLITEETRKLRAVTEHTAGQDIELLEKIVARLVLLDEAANETPAVTATTESAIEAAPENLAVKKLEQLSFFEQLARQLDSLSVYRRGRTDESLRLCLALNQKLETPLDENQLTAAVCVHDVGMAFIPQQILHKTDVLSKDERHIIRAHVTTATQLLSCISGWQQAAQMVNQHHERFDGDGYPHGLSGTDIHPGAMIIALADTYFAITNERSDRSYKKSLFSAVKLINSEADRQFSAEMVEHFNDTVRELYIHRTDN